MDGVKWLFRNSDFTQEKLFFTRFTLFKCVKANFWVMLCTIWKTEECSNCEIYVKGKPSSVCESTTYWPNKASVVTPLGVSIPLFLQRSGAHSVSAFRGAKSVVTNSFSWSSAEIDTDVSEAWFMPPGRVKSLWKSQCGMHSWIWKVQCPVDQS